MPIATNKLKMRFLEVTEETQMLLLEVTEDSELAQCNSGTASCEDTFYVLLLPTLEGPFRAAMQGTPANELEFCIESGKWITVNYQYVIC